MELPQHEVRQHAWSVLSTTENCTSGRFLTRQEAERRRCAQETSSHDSKLQVLIQVFYTYHTLSGMKIHLFSVLLTFSAATTQSETQKHAFPRIQVPYYELCGTARDLTHLSLQVISISQNRFLVSPFHHFLSIQSSES